jgi:hypothetical protein
MAEFGNYGMAGRAAVFVGHPSGTAVDLVEARRTGDAR